MGGDVGVLRGQKVSELSEKKASERTKEYC